MKSWVESANSPQTDFPIENLPYGVFERGVDAGGVTAINASIGVAIGDQILDLRACSAAGLLDDLSTETVTACVSDSLNALMALGPGHWTPLRRRITEILKADSADAQHLEALLVSRVDTVMRVPAIIGDYTDFFHRSITPRTSGAYFARTIRFRRTTNTSPSAITAGRHRL